MGSPNSTPTWTGSIRKSHTASPQLIGRHQSCPRTPGQPSTRLGHVGTQKGTPDALLPTGTLASPSFRSMPPCRTARGTPQGASGAESQAPHQGKRSPCSQEQQVVGGTGLGWSPTWQSLTQWEEAGREGMHPNAPSLLAACETAVGLAACHRPRPHTPTA